MKYFFWSALWRSFMSPLMTGLGLIILCSSGSFAQSPPKREFRGAWIATFLNIDWPSVPNLSTATQQSQLVQMLDQLKAAGINAVFLQVRSQCDALYQSSIEPWSADLTGLQGRAPAPFYDPLAFAIQECRKRGMEIHAWFNPFRAVSNYNNINSFATNHIARTRPEWLLAQGNLRILNPGIPEVRDYVISVIMDVLRRYDVDGIHFDDYFYPYPPTSGSAFNDDATFAAYHRGFTNRQDWRRDNINLFIQRMHDSIAAVKSWVKFGVSPFGIWRNQSSDANGSATNGLQSYSDVYADSRKWIQQGWVDYLIPQIYWSIGFNAANYAVLVPWWHNNAYGKHIYSGMAAYKVNNGGSDNNWNNPGQLPAQIRLNRQYAHIAGSTLFSTKNILANPLGITDSLRNVLHQYPAIPPAMPWKDNQAPPPVDHLNAQTNGNQVSLRWTAPPPTANEKDKIRHYIVYRSTRQPIDIDDAALIRSIVHDSVATGFNDTLLSPGNYYYTVTTVDRLSNESAPVPAVEVQMVTTSNPVSPAAPVEDVPLTFKVYPHPINSTAIISYELLKPVQLSIRLLDLNGNEMLRLYEGKQNQGKFGIMLDARRLPAGMYVLQFMVNDNSITQRISIVK